ncbi:hypothetical protein BD560DRAFT_382399 [Blakeslea trispora]|nr:hypothetical protein BD560DRAFT_382399 [Blakeslea trispora]
MTDEQVQARLENKEADSQVIVLEDDELESDEETTSQQKPSTEQPKTTEQQPEEAQDQTHQAQLIESVSPASSHSTSGQEAHPIEASNQEHQTPYSTVGMEQDRNDDANTQNYNEIWATIAPQPSPSLKVLQQTMQLNELNVNNTNASDGHSTEDHFKNTQDQGQSKTKKGSSSHAGNSALRQPKASENKDDKPAVGSAEWHRLRRENHKQVERRRRETINDGINEIARIVPGCEKNKGSILQRAAAYIRQLKETETSSMEKWTLEKLLTDQAMSELNRQVEVLKTELDRIRMENSYLKRELEAASCHQRDTSKRQKLDHEK